MPPNRSRTPPRSATRRPRISSLSIRSPTTGSTTCSRPTPRPRTVLPRLSDSRPRWGATVSTGGQARPTIRHGRRTHGAMQAAAAARGVDGRRFGRQRIVVAASRHPKNSGPQSAPASARAQPPQPVIGRWKARPRTLTPEDSALPIQRMTTRASGVEPPGFPARRIAAEVLDGVLRRRRPLDEQLEDRTAHSDFAALPDRDRALVRALVTSVLRRLGTLPQLLGRRLARGLP